VRGRYLRVPARYGDPLGSGKRLLSLDREAVWSHLGDLSVGVG
jgi:hypothetical protein